MKFFDVNRVQWARDLNRRYNKRPFPNDDQKKKNAV